MKETRKIFSLMLLAAVPFGSLLHAPQSSARVIIADEDAAAATGLGTIRGVVRDQSGNAIAGAVIALLREGVATVRQVSSAADGSFVARVSPGRYSLTAMAEGFSVVSLPNVEVGRAEEVAYRFNLVRSGGGNTLPERRAERNSSKYRVRANATRRSIFQQNEGTGETLPGETIAEVEEMPIETDDEREGNRVGQTTVETYFAASANPAARDYLGVNFATIQPINDRFELVFAGQTGTNDAPQRFETAARLKLGEQHRVTFNVGGAKLDNFSLNDDAPEIELGQLSFQATDEWRVKDGVILVLGVDYSRFFGASDAASIAPRLGVQFEVDARTRINAAYTTRNETRSWQQAADLEDSRILFRQPEFDSLAVVDRRPMMPKMRRLEFGFERVLDNASSIEAAAFFDATTNRGIGLVNLPVGFSNIENQFSTGIQNGSAQGFRLVYSRRLNEIFSTSIGYSAGRGQQLSQNGLNSPLNLFENAFFQSIAAQVSANLDSGTEIQTVFRLSPEAAVFAIDPFAGRLAVYDPSLSILVTQKLPTLGLPVRAKAIIDARNLFDFKSQINNGETALQLNSSRRILRGGIAVRF